MESDCSRNCEIPREEEKTLEELFEELDGIMEEMNSGQISLEHSFQLYHQGMLKLKACNDRLDRVEKKMIVLQEEGI